MYVASMIVSKHKTSSITLAVITIKTANSHND
jgi:hypothetical protein